MKDIHRILKAFKDDCTSIYAMHEAMGKEIHEKGGPIPEKYRWLIKVAISGASGHTTALETHIMKARETGASEDEILHALLLLIQTTGFPTFMEAYTVFEGMRADVR